MKGQFGVFEEVTLCRDVAQVKTPTPRAKPDPTQDNCDDQDFTKLSPLLL